MRNRKNFPGKVALRAYVKVLASSHYEQRGTLMTTKKFGRTRTTPRTQARLYEQKRGTTRHFYKVLTRKVQTHPRNRQG